MPCLLLLLADHGGPFGDHFTPQFLQQFPPCLLGGASCQAGPFFLQAVAFPLEVVAFPLEALFAFLEGVGPLVQFRQAFLESSQFLFQCLLPLVQAVGLFPEFCAGLFLLPCSRLPGGHEGFLCLQVGFLEEGFRLEAGLFPGGVQGLVRLLPFLPEGGFQVPSPVGRQDLPEHQDDQQEAGAAQEPELEGVEFRLLFRREEILLSLDEAGEEFTKEIVHGGAPIGWV